MNLQSLQVLIPIFLAIGAGGGWFARRFITGEHHKEDAESIKRAVELKIFLDQNGISFPEARQMRDSLRQGRQPITPAIAKAIGNGEAEGAMDISYDGTRIDFRETNVGMKLGMFMRLEQLDAEINYLITAFSHDATDARAAAIEASQNAWREYRDRESEVAELLWEGGSGGPLLGLSRQVEISEYRKEELEKMVEEEAKL